MRATVWMLVISTSMTMGCVAPAASTGCIEAWEASVDEGEACEASIAPLLGDPADPTAPPPEEVDSADRTARDASSGIPTGRRQHRPIRLDMELD